MDSARFGVRLTCNRTKGDWGASNDHHRVFGTKDSEKMLVCISSNHRPNALQTPEETPQWEIARKPPISDLRHFDVLFYVIPRYVYTFLPAQRTQHLLLYIFRCPRPRPYTSCSVSTPVVQSHDGVYSLFAHRFFCFSAFSLFLPHVGRYNISQRHASAQ